MMTNKETWEFINTFAPWLSAIGTILAVLVSLYLALRNENIRLKINIGIRTLIVEDNGPGHGQEYVWLSITNISRRSATITGFGWRFNPLLKSFYYWIAPRNILSSQLPITIGDGQTANYASEIESFRDDFRETAIKELKGLKKYWKRYLIRIYVSTSTGNYFSANIEENLYKEMCSLANKNSP